MRQSTRGIAIVYIYALTDALTGEVYYIGQTYRPKQRLAEHFYGCTGWRSPSDTDGKWPGMIILETTASKEHANERERFWIAKYAEEGAPLTNEYPRNILRQRPGPPPDDSGPTTLRFPG